MFRSACALLLAKHEKTMTSEKKFALTISHLNFELKSHEKKFVTKGESHHNGESNLGMSR